MSRRYLLPAFMIFGLAVLTACTKSTSEPQDADEPVLLHVTPVGGAIGVNPDSSITIEFSHPMGTEMEMYAVLHEGDTSGPLVWGWAVIG